MKTRRAELLSGPELQAGKLLQVGLEEAEGTDPLRLQQLFSQRPGGLLLLLGVLLQASAWGSFCCSARHRDFSGL